MTQIQKVEPKNITDQVQNRIAQMQVEGSIQIPNNYSPQNALKSAWLVLQEAETKDEKPVLQACTQASIANALMNMVTQGLNPAKNQCYFIPYGNQLTLSRSYLGTIAITKRLAEVKDVKGYAVYKDDKFELGFDILTGRTTVKSYEPGTDRDPKNLIGAFAIIIGEKEILHVEYMAKAQIEHAWSMGAANGNSKAHNKFPDQMAIKTVVNRACKYYAQTSDDAGLVNNLLNESVDETDARHEAHLEKANSEEFIEADYEAIPDSVDEETGEILDEQDDFLGADFEPLDEEKAPF